MPLSIDGLALARASIVIYIIIMCCHLYMAVGFARSLKAGKNGITLGLMLLFFSLVNEHFYLSIVATLLLYPDIYNYYLAAIWLWRILTLALIVAAFIILFIQFWEAGRRDKSI